MTGRCRIKKAVVRMAEFVAVVVPVHGMLTFLAVMYSLVLLGLIVWVSFVYLEYCRFGLSV